MLELLLAAQGRVVSAEELLERVWDEMADPFSSAVKVTMSRLRRKLGDPPRHRDPRPGGLPGAGMKPPSAPAVAAVRRLSLVQALPRRTVRLRLTAIYVTLFLASGAGLLTITYLLVDNHSQLPAMITIGGSTAPPAAFRVPSVTLPAGSGATTGSGPLVGAGGPGQPGGPADSQVCVRASSSSATTTQQLGQCAAFFRSQESAQRTSYLNTLLIGSLIALAAMTVVAVGLGWLMAGRVLRPLRTITWAARTISASNLHRAACPVRPAGRAEGTRRYRRWAACATGRLLRRATAVRRQRLA